MPSFGSTILSIAVGLGLALLVVSVVAGAASHTQLVPDQYIVVLRDDIVDPQQVADQMGQQYGLLVGHVYEYSLRGFAARIPRESLAAVRADSRVLFVSEDRQVGAFSEPSPAGSGP